MICRTRVDMNALNVLAEYIYVLFINHILTFLDTKLKNKILAKKMWRNASQFTEVLNQTTRTRYSETEAFQMLSKQTAVGPFALFPRVLLLNHTNEQTLNWNAGRT
jgi:hypothetical protein